MNVLFISLDTVRADFLTFRDPKTSAHMTELARNGTVFTQAISGTSWTLPAHVQVFTGTPPERHGVQSDFEVIDPLVPYLPEILQRGGYATLGMFTVRYLWGDYGFSRGFDVYRSAMYAEDVANDGLAFAPGQEESLARMKSASKDDYITSPHVIALARRSLERSKPNQPVFMFAHFFDPHHDYVPPPPWDTAFDPDYKGDVDGRQYLANKRVADPMKDPKRQINDRDLEHIKALYRGEIAWTDQWIGELIGLFREHRRLDDTLIVIAADHGEEFFEHGYIFHRGTLMDESVRVPLLIVPPKSMPGSFEAQVDMQVSLSDIMPTILDFIGEEVPDSVMGRSLKPAMLGEPLEARPELLSLYVPQNEATHQFVDVVHHAIRMPEFKFIRQVRFPGSADLQVAVGYFDLINDPGETQGISDTNDPRVKKAWNLLESTLDATRERWRTEPRTPDAKRRTRIRENFEEELMALGYIEVGSAGAVADGPPRPWGGLEPMPAIPIPGAGWRRRDVIGFVAAGIVLLLAVPLARRYLPDLPAR